MKNLLKLDENRKLDEIVFEHRNKLYGAYALRKEEGSVLNKAMFLGISIFLALAITPVVISSFNHSISDGPDLVAPPEWVLPPDVEKDPPAPAVVTPPVQKPVATYNSVLPTPTKAAKELPVTVVNKDEAVPGFQDAPGEKPKDSYTPPVVNPGPTQQVSTTPAKVKDPNAVVKEVDVQAEFSGGIQAFRKKVAQNFNTSDYEGSGEKISALVTFIVERDGSISAVKASGADADFNKEAEKTVKSIKGNWKPAMLDGEKVRSYFRMPISMQFD
jgi:protein TonB